MNSSAIFLYHVHDPMCSWCWGFRRSWDKLRDALPTAVSVVDILGGLAPDSDQSMPFEQQLVIAGYWAAVSDQTGAEFNFDFWKKCSPRRSTYPACRAVLAKGEDLFPVEIDYKSHVPMLDAICGLLRE